MRKDDVLDITGEGCRYDSKHLNRRDFFRYSAAGLAGLALSKSLPGQKSESPPEIKTNIAEVKDIPRKKTSLPGRYPGKVIRINTGETSVEGKINGEMVREAAEKGMRELTGKRSMKKVWRQFVSPGDVVGIKVNPIAGKPLSTKPEVVDCIINGLLEAGVPKENIIIWDRRHFQLAGAGFPEERFPGIKLMGTEMRGPNNEFYEENGRLWSLDNIDREYTSYSAEVEQKYNERTLPYMINEGKHSYFSKIVTQTCTKIINVPILKNAGSSVSLCCKNLAYGALSNTGRLHKLWAKSVAEPLAFPCLRDKVVLNIVDGLRGCYDGGPGANPKYIWDSNIMLFGTDPVAVDRAGYEFILKERIERGIQQFEDKKGREFLAIASGLELGENRKDKIELREINLS